MKEAIFFCMVGLPLFGKESSGTPVFKILVRALDRKERNLVCLSVSPSAREITGVGLADF